MMDKTDIHIEKVIVHILDSSIGMPVLSDTILDYGSDFVDFLREHIYKVASGDDIKTSTFYEDSQVKAFIEEYRADMEAEGSFEIMSKNIGNILYQIMNQNIDIPSADLMVVRYRYGQKEFLGLLKMNYKSCYTHMTGTDEGGNCNSIVNYKTILPGESQKLCEAALIDMQDGTITLLERKYEVNGTKENYFSKRFLQCSGKLSSKAKLSIFTKAVEAVQKEFVNESDQWEANMKAKAVLHEEILQQGEISIPQVADRIFENQIELKEKFNEKMEKYNMAEEIIQPQNNTTTKKFEKQCLLTDTGIEIKIPMEQYQNGENVEFITNTDGTISVLIKNIGHIQSK